MQQNGWECMLWHSRLWWEKLDLNQRSLAATDLQSAPFDQTLAFSHIGSDFQESDLSRLVAPAGFEPALAVYEAAVLPVERKSSMVRLEGIEPPTFGLRVRCSSC